MDMRDTTMETTNWLLFYITWMLIFISIILVGIAVLIGTQ